MKTYENVEISTRQVIDVACDMCGKSCQVTDDYHNSLEDRYSYGEFSFSGGYYGQLDGCRIDLHFCEECVVTFWRQVQRRRVQRIKSSFYAETGYDTRLIAEAYDLSLTQVATMIDYDPQVLGCNPQMSDAQPMLSKLVNIYVLYELTARHDDKRMDFKHWFHRTRIQPMFGETANRTILCGSSLDDIMETFKLWLHSHDLSMNEIIDETLNN